MRLQRWRSAQRTHPLVAGSLEAPSLAEELLRYLRPEKSHGPGPRVDDGNADAPSVLSEL